jgi:hypothetical protein
MTDGFKGYVTVTGISPIRIRKIADPVGITCKKSSQQARRWFSGACNFLPGTGRLRTDPFNGAATPIMRHGLIFEAG